jgi:hypothetical protein
MQAALQDAAAGHATSTEALEQAQSALATTTADRDALQSQAAALQV